MVFAKHDDVVEKLAANASNGTLRGPVLPWASECGPFRINAKALNRMGDCRREDRVVVIDHEPVDRKKKLRFRPSPIIGIPLS
jgi:hypothetical protein